MSPEEIHRRHRHALSRLVPRPYTNAVTGERYTVLVEPDADPRFLDSLCEALDGPPYVSVTEDPLDHAKAVKAQIEAAKAKYKAKSSKRSKGAATLFGEADIDQYHKET